MFTRLHRLYIGKMTTPIFEDPRDQGLKKISGTQHDYRLIINAKRINSLSIVVPPIIHVVSDFIDYVSGESRDSPTWRGAEI